MPFVRRHRTYYKDGVEVPASSITDFGSYKYFKNIVTTKYWKEITTGSRELAYACYYNQDFYVYNYAKTPIGSSLSRYYNKNSANILVTDVSDFKEDTRSPWKSVTENSATDNLGTFSRYRDGDLYIDTTVTEIVEGTPEDYTYTTEEITPVEVTADDDYDFTEFVPSTQFDNYEDRNKLYNIIKRNRTYYKYVYQDWTQPVLTANGELGGDSFACAVSSLASGKPAYYALDGNTSTEWRGTTATDEFIFYNPKPLKVTKLSLVQFTGSSYRYWTTSGNVYGSNDNNDWTLLTSYTNDVKDFVIDLSSNDQAFKYYKIKSETSTYRCSISELTITAQERITVESTETDADYYTDKIIAHSPMTSKTKMY